MSIEKKASQGDVLIIEDDPAITEILEVYCKNMGCFRNILKAADGSMASSKMRNQKFSVILLDIKLPKKGGLDLVRELDDKSLNTRMNILVVSGTLDKTVLEKMVAMGVKNFLPKPFTEASFQERVLKLLAGK